MEFEQCEIRANHYGVFLPFSWKWDFVAQATGPNGTYTVARSMKFPPTEDNRYELIESPLEWEILNALINHLVHVGWEPLANSGVHWYSKKFRRPVSMYVPDPEPSTPYTLGDEVKWHKETQKAIEQYEKRKDAASRRKLANCSMQLGLALERLREFESAYNFYRGAASEFDQIHAAEEAAKARRWADRVSKLYERTDEEDQPETDSAAVAEALHQLEKLPDVFTALYDIKSAYEETDESMRSTLLEIRLVLHQDILEKPVTRFALPTDCATSVKKS